ncbi:MAG: hypothetical protein F7C33_04860 [Desulfurococcales archaeon]|nr:hypothetical protein [Desulfurococcales archaeon]
MKCSGELAPNWLEYASRGTLIPGLQPFYLLSGKDSLEAGGVPSVTWTCHGDYEIRINGGGLLAENPVPPLLDYYTEPLPTIAPWGSLQTLNDTLGEDLEEPVIVNPLSWDPLAPVTLKDTVVGPPGCVTDGANSYYWGRLDPLRAVKTARCARLRAKSALEQVKLGHLSLAITGESYRANDLEVVKTGNCTIVRAGSALTVQGECKVTFETNLWEYNIGILYPSCYHTIRAVGKKRVIGPVPALIVGLNSHVAMASRRGVRAVIEPGLVQVEVRGSLRIALAGAAGAYRLFLEDLVDWAMVKAPKRGYGNTRSSYGVIVLVGASPGEIRFSLSNPLDEAGMAEVRLPYLGEKAVLYGPYGVEEIPVSMDLVRVPLPPGFHGCLSVRLSGEKKLLRMIRRFRGQ